MNWLNRIPPERLGRGLWWTDAWSLIGGCLPVSPGCDHCWSAAQTYIRGHQVKNEKMRNRYQHLAVHDKIRGARFRGPIRIHHADLRKPLHASKPRVYVIWNDLFNPAVRWQFIDQVFAVMHKCPEHYFLILTKRAENMCSYQQSRGHVLANVAYGTTVCNADELTNAQWLMRIEGIPLFLSIEPMLSPISLRWIGGQDFNDKMRRRKGSIKQFDGLKEFGLIIVGGESGPHARPMHPDWARTIRDQCQGAQVPFLFKQWGEFADYSERTTECRGRQNQIIAPDGELLGVGIGKNGMVESDWQERGGCWMCRVGKREAGRKLDGQIWNGLETY